MAVQLQFSHEAVSNRIRCTWRLALVWLEADRGDTMNRPDTSCILVDRPPRRDLEISKPCNPSRSDLVYIPLQASILIIFTFSLEIRWHPLLLLQSNLSSLRSLINLEDLSQVPTVLLGCTGDVKGHFPSHIAPSGS